MPQRHEASLSVHDHRADEIPQQAAPVVRHANSGARLVDLGDLAPAVFYAHLTVRHCRPAYTHCIQQMDVHFPRHHAGLPIDGSRSGAKELVLMPVPLLRRLGYFEDKILVEVRHHVGVDE